MAIQGRENIMYDSWNDSSSNIPKVKISSSAPKLLHLSPVAQSSILEDFSRIATAIVQLVSGQADTATRRRTLLWEKSGQRHDGDHFAPFFNAVVIVDIRTHNLAWLTRHRRSRSQLTWEYPHVCQLGQCR